MVLLPRECQYLSAFSSDLFSVHLFINWDHQKKLKKSECAAFKAAINHNESRIGEPGNIRTNTSLCGTWVRLQVFSIPYVPSSSVLSALTISFFRSTANPLAQNQHLSHASQTFPLPILITSVDTDLPQPLLLALKTSLAFISPNLKLLVLLWFSQRQWRRQLSDETTTECGKWLPRREGPGRAAL